MNLIGFDYVTGTCGTTSCNRKPAKFLEVAIIDINGSMSEVFSPARVGLIDEWHLDFKRLIEIVNLGDRQDNLRSLPTLNKGKPGDLSVIATCPV